MGTLLFILYTSEMFELVENRLYANADDSTLVALFASQQTDLLLLPPKLDSIIIIKKGRQCKAERE